jgi:hypothetical protein
MSLVLQSSGGGSVTLEEAVTASNYTITVPAVTGTMAIDGPAFSAYQSTLQTLSGSTNTKILFQTEEFDTNNNFASSTFTPTVAGYYQINASAALVTSVATWCNLKLYKNGSYFKQSFAPSSSSDIDVTGFTGLVYANGTTDYFEIYGVLGVGQNTNPSQAVTWFSASLVRAA